MNAKRARLVLASVLLAAGIVTAQQTKQAQIDLQAAIRTETVKGDLKGAIRQYENLISKYPKDRPLVATALMHLADVHRKMGDAEFQKIYQRIVNEFADQTDIAAQASQRLSASGAAPASGALGVRAVRIVGWGGAVMPDGRQFIVSEESGDIAIQDMANPSRIKRLMAKSGGAETLEEAFLPRMSRDQRQIVFVWKQSRKDNRYQLRVMPNEVGGRHRVLLDDKAEYTYFEPAAWSADSKSILAVLWKPDQSKHLAWVSAADGKIQVLRTLEWRIKETSRPSLSPDGRYIAYAALDRSAKSIAELEASSEPSQIYILAADGGNEVSLTKTGINEAPAWTPDGANIVFTSDRSGVFGLWSANVREGKPVGAPSLVMANTGKTKSIGFSASGTYYFARQIHGEGANILIADLDPVTGQLRGVPSLAIEKSPGMNGRPVWSPDGQSIAFHRLSQISPTVAPLTIHRFGTEQEISLPLPHRVLGQPIWFRDGQSLLQGVRGPEGQLLFYRVDVKTGEFKELAAAPRDDGRPTALSPDGNTAYETDVAVNGGQRQAVRAIDLATGQTSEIFSTPGPRGALPHVAVSPDGRTLAMLLFTRAGDRIHESVSIIGVDGRNLRNLYTADRGELQNPPDPLPCVAWTGDGRKVFFPRVTEKGWELMRIAVDGGKPESTGLKGKQMNCMDVSPDGSRIVFGETTDTPHYETAAIDNALARLKTSR
jgi:Tol biopolymer transport system component